MEMTEVRAGPADSVGRVLLFNVHVECVKVQLKLWAANLLDHLQTLLASVDEIRLEPIHWLQRNPPPTVRSITTDFLEVFRDHLPLSAVFPARHGVGAAH